MKHLKILFLAILILPAISFAENFSKIFIGLAGNTPIKLQLTNVDNKIQGFYQYSKDIKSFDNSYVMNVNFITGSYNNGLIKLSSVGSKNKISFIGELVHNKFKGIPIYQINGKWEDAAHSINGPLTFVEQTLSIADNGLLVNQFSTVTNDKNFYSMQLSYPQIKGTNISAASQTINNTIQEFLQKQKNSFLKPLQNNTPLSNMTSSSNILTITNLVTTTPQILSIRFAVFNYYFHAAHGTTHYVSMNFDPATGNLISLSSLFKPGSDYLTMIANIARPFLIQKLSPSFNPAIKNNELAWINKGTEPNEKNYQVWNIYNDQLVLTFQEYQVAAYVVGAPTIMIPLEKLAGIANPIGLVKF